MKKLVKLAVIVGGATLVAKLIATKKSKWQDLTEAEVREKLDRRLPHRVSEEKRAVVADEIVSKMRKRGAIREEDPSAQTTASDAQEEPDSDSPEADDGSQDDTESV